MQSAGDAVMIRKTDGSAADYHRMEMLKQIARGIAAHFGPNCEVVIHDLAGPDGECAIAHIENGHVTGRRVGDGPSKVVVEQLLHSEESPQDQLSYLTRTPDGKILKSSTGFNVTQMAMVIQM